MPKRHFGSMVPSPEMSKLASVPQTLNFGNNLSFDDDDDIPMNMPGVSPLLNSSNSTSSVSSAVEAKIRNEPQRPMRSSKKPSTNHLSIPITRTPIMNEVSLSLPVPKTDRSQRPDSTPRLKHGSKYAKFRAKNEQFSPVREKTGHEESKHHSPDTFAAKFLV